jgi:hypothetical protein
VIELPAVRKIKVPSTAGFLEPDTGACKSRLCKVRVDFILGSKTKETPNSSNPIGKEQNFGPKEFPLSFQ